jgi:hypothetical protein
MKYSLERRPEAEEELARTRISAGNRKAIISATHRIDQELIRDADKKGTSHFGNLRVLLVKPLLVFFDFIPGDRLVRIIQVIPETS